MKVQEKTIENCQAILTIEVEEAEMKAALDEVYKQASEQVEIPGFRKGKAPRELIEKHVGKEKIQKEAIEKVAPEVIQKAIIQENINYYGRPAVEVLGNEPLVLKTTVPMPPEIELGDYRTLKTKKEKVKITSKEVDETIESIQKQMADWQPVDRPVQAGDMITINLESEVEGKPFIKEQGSQYQVEPDKTSYLPGLANEFVGMGAGEEKKFELKLADDYPVAEMAGKTASFQAKVLEVKQEELPDVDDDMAKKVAPDIEDLKSLKERIKTNLEAKQNQKARSEYEVNLLDELIEKSKLNYPPALLDNEIEKMIENQVRQWQMYSRSKEEFEERLKQTSYQSLKEQFKEPAEKRLKRSLVLSKFANEENITVSEDEVNAEIERIASEAGDKKDERLESLNKPETRNSIHGELMTTKALQRLTELAEKPTKNKKDQKNNTKTKSEEEKSE